MTSGNEMIPTGSRTAATAGVRTARTGRRGRRLTGVLAAVAVIGFTAAIVTPTGMALADPPTEEPPTAYSLAAADAQDITVTSGVRIAPLVRGAFEVYVPPPPEPEPVVSSGGGGGGLGAVFYTGGGAPAEWMSAAGIDPADWGYVDYIVSRESGWNPNAVNSSSGASGLVQALPCGKVPGNCFDPVDNLRWANGYANGRYGSWAQAYAFWTSNHWW